jgi:hypothetical protein
MRSYISSDGRAQDAAAHELPNVDVQHIFLCVHGVWRCACALDSTTIVDGKIRMAIAAFTDDDKSTVNIAHVRAALVEVSDDRLRTHLAHIIAVICTKLITFGPYDPGCTLILLKVAMEQLRRCTDVVLDDMCAQRLMHAFHCHWESRYGGCADVCAQVFDVYVRAADGAHINNHLYACVHATPWWAKGRLRLITVLLPLASAHAVCGRCIRRHIPTDCRCRR